MNQTYWHHVDALTPMSNIVRQHAVNIQCEDKTHNIHVSDDKEKPSGSIACTRKQQPRLY